VGGLVEAKGQDYNGRDVFIMKLAMFADYLQAGDLCVVETAMLDESVLREFWIDCGGRHGVAAGNTGFSTLIHAEATPWVTVREEIS